MEGFAIGAGLGLVGILTIVIVGYILNYRLVNEASEDKDDRKVAEEIAKHESAKSALLEKNVAALAQEVSELKTQNNMLKAQLVAAEKTVDELHDSIQANSPGALPDALRAQLDRLREKVSGVPAAAAGGDPDRGEAGGVHETTPKRDP